MRIARAWALMLAGAGLLVGCRPAGEGAEPEEKKAAKAATTEKKDKKGVTVLTPVKAAGKPLVLEVESFKLDKAEIRALKGASGGKAVLFKDEAGGAKITVTLKKGDYDVTVYGQAPDAESDAFYLSLAGTEERLYTEDHGKLSKTKTLKVTVAKDGPCDLKIEPAETGFYLDKVEIRKAK